MTRDEHLKFCKQCTNRKFETKRGLICSITGELADFEETCENFNVDEVAKAELEDREKEEAQKAGETIGYNMNMAPEIKAEMRSHQDMFMGIVGGLFVAVISALLWALITVATGYQIGYMAIAVGLLVGVGVRYFGAGVDLSYGVIGAVMAFLGCALGNALSQIAFIAQAENLEIYQTFQLLGFSGLVNVLTETFHPMDLLFYGIAVYEGFRFAFRPMPETMPANGDLTPKNTKFRLPLVMVFFLFLAGSGYVVLSGSEEGGQYTYYYEDGSVQAEGGMANGKENGNWTIYYPDGTIQSEGAFEDGLEVGEWKFYNQQAQLIKVGGYKQGLMDSTWLVYDEHGTLLESTQYEQSRLNGTYKSYYENGTLNEEGLFERNQKTGTWKSYYANGELYATGDFKNNIPTRIWTYYLDHGQKDREVEYDENGTMRFLNVWDESGHQLVANGNGSYIRKSSDDVILQSGLLENGLPKGEWKEYFTNGQMSEVYIYLDSMYQVQSSWSPEGEPIVVEGNGHYIDYDDSGDIKLEEGELVNGLREGEWVSYYTDNGAVHERSNYIKGKLNGPTQQFFQSGAISLEGSYLDDRQDGEWKWFYESGEIETTVSFVNGKKSGVQVINSELGIPTKEEYYENGKLLDEKLL